MATRPGAAQDAQNSPQEQIRQLWKHRWIVVCGVALALCLDALWVLRQPKIYAATSVLQFEPNPARPLGRQVEDLDTSGVGSYWNIREYYETQYRVLKSRAVAEAVVRQLGLQHDPDFMGVAQTRRASFRSVSVETAAVVLIGRIRVEPVKESRLVNLVVEDRSPRRAKLVADTLLDVFVRRNLDLRLQGTRDAVRWLGNQLNDLQTNLSNSEAALQTFRRRNNIVSDNFADQRNILGNRIGQLSEALTQAQTRRFQLAARTGEIVRAEREVLRSLEGATEGGASGMAVDASPADRVRWRTRVGAAMSQLSAPEFLTSSVLSSLRTQFEIALREESTVEIRYLQQSLELRGARARTNAVVSLFRAEVANIRGAAEAELRGVQRSEASVRGELSSAQHLAVELNQQEMEYSGLTRARDNHAKIYGIVLERTTEGNLMSDLQVNNMRVLEYSLLPAVPIKPRVPLTLAMGGVAGLVLGVLGAVVAMLADRTVRSRTDVEEGLRTPVLGFLPLVSGRGMRNQYKYRYGDTQVPEGPVENLDLVVHSHPGSMIAELARGIRTNLLFMSPDRPFQMLMVTSASPREGKTFTAVSLAISLAQSGKRVLLVDADLRRPRVHKVFGVRPPVGLTSILIGEATHDEAIIESEVPNLSLLPCGPIPPNPAELLHSQKASETFAYLRANFDRVIVDSPPITAVNDALALGPQLDGVVLVVRMRQTRRDQAASVLRQLRSLGSTVAGCVLNAIEPNSDSPSYYYAGSYDYSPSPADLPSPRPPEAQA